MRTDKIIEERATSDLSVTYLLGSGVAYVPTHHDGGEGGVWFQVICDI